MNYPYSRDPKLVLEMLSGLFIGHGVHFCSTFRSYGVHFPPTDHRTVAKRARPPRARGDTEKVSAEKGGLMRLSESSSIFRLPRSVRTLPLTFVAQGASSNIH